MSDEATDILISLQNSTLPNLDSGSNLGLETSERGLVKTNFGLQTLNEGLSPKHK